MLISDEYEKEKRTHESLGNDEAVTPDVTSVDWVIDTKYEVPDLDDSIVTWGLPWLQCTCSV